MIQYIEASHLFHLHNRYLSMVLSLRPDEEGCPELLTAYIGAPLDQPEAALALIPRWEGASFDSLRQKLPYACPADGRGDYRPPLVCVRDAQGQNCTELFYESHRIEAGKPRLEGLPASYVESAEEADTLIVTLADPLTGLKAEMM